MKSIMLSLTVATALSFSTQLPSRLEAQLPSLNQNAAGAANATQRAQLQVKQQVQARAQQQIQSQVQQRLQPQVQQRIQAQTQQRVQSQARLNLPTPGALRVDANAAARVDVSGQGQRSRMQGRANTNSNLNVELGRGIPVSLTAREMSDLDVVFGEFNPFRRRQNNQSPQTENSNEQANSTAGNQQSEESSNQNANDESSRPENGRRGLGANLVFNSEQEFQASILSAVRQRQAEISAIRDRALSRADTQLMAQADRLEGLLETYVSAMAKTNASTESAINRNPFESNTGNAVIQAGAESQAEILATPANNESPETENPEAE